MWLLLDGLYLGWEGHWVKDLLGTVAPVVGLVLEEPL